MRTLLNKKGSEPCALSPELCALSYFLRELLLVDSFLSSVLLEAWAGLFSLVALLCDDRVVAAGWREPEELCDLALCDGLEADLSEADDDSLLTAGAFCFEDDLISVLLLTAGADLLSVFAFCCEEDLVSVLLFTAGVDLLSVFAFCCEDDLISVLLFTAGADLLSEAAFCSEDDLFTGFSFAAGADLLVFPVLVSDEDLVAGL